MGWNSQVVIATLVIIEGDNDGLFVYNGTPALGNLIDSISAVDGTDSYGNAYLAGTASYFFAGGTKYLAATLTGGALSFWESSTGAGGPYSAGGGIGGGGSSNQYVTTDLKLVVQDGAAAADPSITSPLTAETWHSIPLASGWSVPSGGPTPSVKLLPDGRVATAGEITRTAFSGNATISTITNANYLPTSQQNWNDAITGSRISLSTGGVMEVFGAPAGTTTIAWTVAYPIDL